MIDCPAICRPRSVEGIVQERATYVGRANYRHGAVKAESQQHTSVLIVDGDCVGLTMLRRKKRALLVTYPPLPSYSLCRRTNHPSVLSWREFSDEVF